LLLPYLSNEEHFKYLRVYKGIQVHLVFEVKNDTRHIDLMVAGVHLTDPKTTDSSYSRIVSFCCMDIVIAAGCSKTCI
jgi:hypothetical protein